MKKVWILCLIAAMLLWGCTAPTLETLSDVYETQPPAEMMAIHLELPEEAAEAVMEGGDGTRLYLCDGYELRLQTMGSQSIDDVLQSVTGYGEDRLTVMKTRSGEYDRYDCVWCTTGEEGEQIGRTAVLNDGSYFYCVSALASSEMAYDLNEVWQQILGSFTLG